LEDNVFNNSFKGLVLILEEVGFYFTYLMDNELVNNNSIKERILE